MIPIRLILKWPGKALRLVRPSTAEKQFLNVARSVSLERKLNARDGSPLTIVAQRPQDPFYLMRFLPLLESFRARPNTKIHFVNLRLEFEPIRTIERVKRWLRNRRWARAYGLTRADRMTFDFARATPAAIAASARELLATVRSKDDVVALRFDGLRVGDLIYDTYLRFKPAPTVDLNDPMLAEITAHALMIYRELSAFFHAHKVDLVITSYGTYVHHGILARLALAHGSKAYALGQVDPFVRELTPDLPSHGRDYTRYRQLFAALSEAEKKSALIEAESALTKRFEGEIDAATWYMNASSYADSAEDEQWASRLLAVSERKILLQLHCFFDSPHIYRSLVFPDFYEWADFVLKEACSHSDLQVFVKPHPNGVEGNDAVVKRLMARHPRAQLLPAQISNRALVRCGFDACFTAYGTVAHEFPFFGVPAVNAGDNPHADYRFCEHPRTKQELAALIGKAARGELRVEAARDEILEFYYMHNLYPHVGRGSAETRVVLRDINHIHNFGELEFERIVGRGRDALRKTTEAILEAAQTVVPGL